MAVDLLLDKTGAVYTDDLISATGLTRESICGWLRKNQFIKPSGPTSKRWVKIGGTRTCIEPGCTNKIYYDVPAIRPREIPLYCEKHRSTTGRHAATTTICPRNGSSEQTTIGERAGKSRRYDP